LAAFQVIIIGRFWVIAEGHLLPAGSDPGRTKLISNARLIFMQAYRKLTEHLDRDLEHEEVDTVSGLVLALLERPPEPGNFVEYRGVRFTVSKVAGHGVGICTVEVLAPNEDASKKKGDQ
jgi:CBS domain containing-hemolysin-like protein